MDKPEGYFFTAFREAIVSIGRTVLILMPLKDSIPLTRAWCVWEMFCTIHDTHAELVIALPPSEKKELKRMLSHELDDIVNILTNVKVENSEAFEEKDRLEILRTVVDQCEGGINGVNGAICAGLREWLCDTAMTLVTDGGGGGGGGEVVESEGLLRLMNQVGVMLQDQGRLEEAEVMYRRALEGRERLLGSDHPDTLSSVDNLGSLLADLGQLEEAEIIFINYIHFKNFLVIFCW